MNETIYIQENNKKRKATANEIAQFEKDRAEFEAEKSRIEAEQTAKREARESAIKKLAEVAGLSKDELDAIL